MAESRGTWWCVLGAVAAVVAPAAMLHGLADGDRLSAGLTAAPFGWRRLLVAHLAAAVPLGFALAGRLNPRPDGHVLGWFIAAVAATAFAPAALPSLAEALNEAGAGLLVRALVRSVASVILVTPWAGAALTLARAGGAPSRWQVAAAVVLATVPPGVYAERLIETRSASLGTLTSAGRAVRARQLLGGLTDLAGDVGMTDRRRQLDQVIALAETLAAREPRPTAPVSARLTRAFAFIQLDRPGDTEAILAPLADSDSTAALLLGAAYRQWDRWADAERTYQRVLDELLPRVGRDPRVVDDCVTAYDGAAEARRNLGRPAEAARGYDEALQRLPGKRAYLHLQLGVHEADQGRSARALRHFAEATRLDASLEAMAAPHLRRLQESTSSCWVPRLQSGR
jgi:tetratricopeptide (TPR) repeat protein